ncbi:YfcL family protein [Vibrio sp. SCSIO 43137]|uniref:YfcL family protein n=1 Tax=Vibrio sp. SCSIO 43137 TaxID=3021011 RepID=UPI0023076B19|nr:YfcL family protein [Vibrio sp. SCSIO 43137]WCE28934.1 YfcL family protein [Vibrio sp. SCSIO 43137]
MILQYEEKLLDKIDASVATASDDELFAGGYLRGHISLAAADCESEGVSDIEVMKARVEASLEEARSELSPADRIIVSELWSELKTIK